MAMNNTYTRQVMANPTGLNPNQQQVQKYDAMNDLIQTATKVGQNMVNMYAKAKDDNDREQTKLLVDEREAQRQNAAREVMLNQDPSGWEDAYDKKLKKIDSDFAKRVPERYTEEYNEWTTLNDERGRLDLKYQQTKKMQDNSRELLFDRVERNAKNVIGADAGYTAMIDSDTQGSLKGALNRGLITRAQYDKAMRNYAESKTYNALNDQLIRDPEGLALALKNNQYGLNAKDLKSWTTKVNNELKINDMRNKTAENNQIEANTLEALSILKQRQDVPQNLLNQLPPKTQAALQKVREYAVTGNDVPTDANVYSFLNEMRQENPARFKNLNLYDYAGDLDTETLHGLREAQNAIVFGVDGKAKINPDIKHDDLMMKSAYNSLGLKDNEEKYDFQNSYDSEVRGFMAEKGRVPTQLERQDIMEKLRKNVARRRAWWFDTTTPAVQLDEDDTPYVKKDDISDNTKASINAILERNPNYDLLTKLSDSDQDELMEDMAGVFERPRDQWNSATTKVINKYLAKVKE